MGVVRGVCGGGGSGRWMGRWMGAVDGDGGMVEPFWYVFGAWKGWCWVEHKRLWAWTVGGGGWGRWMGTVGWLSGSIRWWFALQPFFGVAVDGAVLGSWWELVGVGGVTYGCGSRWGWSWWGLALAHHHLIWNDMQYQVY